MRIRTLGPLEVFDGARWCPLAAKQRALLATLAVSAGRVVSIDQLIDELWGESPPVSAVNLVQVYVARLRRALEDRDGRLLRTQSPGYRLDVAEDDLDLRRFESLTDRGVTALRDGASQVAADLLTEALALWRGPAFCDVSGSRMARAEADRLEQLKLTALEARVEADLELGRHQNLAAELQALTQAHPLRERFWGQLMLALYRCGRQAEALDAYQRLYRVLDDELGVEPSQPVRELHHQILTNDQRLEISQPKTGTGGEIVPRQLPADLCDFIGRQEHLCWLDAVAGRSGDKPAAVVIAAVSGAAGTGKTTLAVHWAHQVADRFPDGQLYVNLRGFGPPGREMAPTEAVRSFLDAFAVAPERIPVDLDAQAGLYRSWLSGKRVLVVLDNARDADQVRPLLPGSPGCLAVVTSRNDLAGLVAKEGARSLTLDLLSPPEARQFLVHRLGQDCVTAEPKVVEQIVAACARLPLALAIVAARAATHPGFSLQALAAELRDSRNRLDVLACADTSTDVRSVFSWSYQQLTPEAQRLFRLLGLHPGPDISAPATASLSGIAVDQIRLLLAELTGAHLVNEHTPGRYTSHDLLHAYAAELTHACDTQTQRHAAQQRILDHYLHTAHAAARRLNPHRDLIALAPAPPQAVAEPLADRGQAMAWFSAERQVLLAAIDWAAKAGFDSHVWQLSWALDGFLDHQGHWHDRAVARKASLEAALRLGDRFAQADSHRGLAGAYIRLRRLNDAELHLRQALDLYTECGDRAGRAHTHRNLCWVYEQQGDYTRALAHDMRALELHCASGHVIGQANALNSIGWLHARLGKHTLALKYSRSALELFQELHDRDGQAAAWNSLGYAHHHLQHFDDAATCYQRAIHLYRELDNRYDQAEALTHLGDTRHAAGDPDAAHQAWRQALDILHHLDHSHAEAVRTKLDQLERTWRGCGLVDASVSDAPYTSSPASSR